MYNKNMITEKIKQAYDFGVMYHGAQVRKYTNEPYMVHPKEVMETLISYNITDEAVLCAALLHDVIEDTPATKEDIAEKFGDKVAQLVVELSDVSKPSDGNRKVRKELDRQHIANGSSEAQNIKLADIKSNVQSIAEYDKGFASLYIKEKLAVIDVLSKADTVLLNDVKAYLLKTKR